MTTKDEILVAQFKAGDSKAFDQLMMKYKQNIYLYVYRQVGKHEDAEYITRDVFLKVFEALPMWEPQACFSTWLFTIAHNRCMDYYRVRSTSRGETTCSSV